MKISYHQNPLCTTIELDSHDQEVFRLNFNTTAVNPLPLGMGWMSRTYEPKADWEGWEPHAPRWKKEANSAYEWLVTYKEEYLGKL